MESSNKLSKTHRENEIYHFWKLNLIVLLLHSTFILDLAHGIGIFSMEDIWIQS